MPSAAAAETTKHRQVEQLPLEGERESSATQEEEEEKGQITVPLRGEGERDF